MNIAEWTTHFNQQIEEVKRLSEKFPNLEIYYSDDGFCYSVNNPTENELLQATGCYLKSISYELRLYYTEIGIHVDILNKYLNDYRSLEDFANHICPGGKFLEKLKSLMNETPNQFNNINEWLANK